VRGVCRVAVRTGGRRPSCCSAGDCAGVRGGICTGASFCFAVRGWHSCWCGHAGVVVLCIYYVLALMYLLPQVQKIDLVAYLACMALTYHAHVSLLQLGFGF
jgi:ABC-type transport system involved in cytochrome c biogenesis permease subunit